MLIEFSVANFRSVREKQTLSLIASGSVKDLPSSVIEREIPGLQGIRYLKGAALYGANASGKSNVIKAMRFVRQFVMGSATRLEPNEPTGAEPFKLDGKSSSWPSQFEVSFVANEVRYTFGFSLTRERVTEEYLVAYPKGAPRRWYHRRYDVSTGTYEWGKRSAFFPKDRNLEEKTRPNALFLSVGAQFNQPDLTTVFGWFQDGLGFIGGDAPFVLLDSEGSLPLSDFTAALLEKLSIRERIIGLLTSADVGIVGCTVERKEFAIPDHLRTVFLPEFLKQFEAGDAASNDRKAIQVRLEHKVAGGVPVLLDFASEESAGTQRFFALIGPWIDMLINGLTVFVDEIEASLHPILVRELLRLVLSEKHNTKGAQVVFTTHSPGILDHSLLRRDQVWFTEKDPASGATRLYPLTDYRPRRDEALAKGYLAGRYGAIPFLPEGLQL